MQLMVELAAGCSAAHSAMTYGTLYGVETLTTNYSDCERTPKRRREPKTQTGPAVRTDSLQDRRVFELTVPLAVLNARKAGKRTSSLRRETRLLVG